MGLLDILKGTNKKREAFEFSAAAAQQELANPSSNAQEYVDTIGKLGYLFETTAMQDFFMNNRNMRVFIPAFQTVNRTTNINEHEAQIMWLDFQTLFTMVKLTMPPDDYEQGAMAMFQSLEILASTIITDAKNGWKGHLATENVRRLDVALNKKEPIRR